MESGVTSTVRGSLLFGLVFVLRCCVSFALVQGEDPLQTPGDVSPTQRTPESIGQPAGEADLRDAVQRAEELARDLEAGLKTYREHLKTVLYRLGYGPYHPLFRTRLNGFEQDQIDLEDLDAFKMGLFAFTLKSAGVRLDPDPFADWAELQKRLESFEPTMHAARRVVTQAGIFAVDSEANTSQEVFQKLRKRWRRAVRQATETYGHAIAVRPVLFEDGEMVPAPASVRYIPGGGRYAVVCAFGVCTSGPTNSDVNRVPVNR